MWLITPTHRSVIHGRGEPGATKAPEAVTTVDNTGHYDSVKFKGYAYFI